MTDIEIIELIADYESASGRAYPTREAHIQSLTHMSRNELIATLKTYRSNLIIREA